MGSSRFEDESDLASDVVDDAAVDQMGYTCYVEAATIIFPRDVVVNSAACELCIS